MKSSFVVQARGSSPITAIPCNGQAPVPPRHVAETLTPPASGNERMPGARLIGSCLRERLSHLTALEERVILAIVYQRAIDEKTLLKVVADEAHVSKAMLIKIAKKLGFDGFRSLRAALAEYNRLPMAEIHEELCNCPTPRALAEKVCRISIKA